jgi:hypothetical protein
MTIHIFHKSNWKPSHVEGVIYPPGCDTIILTYKPYLKNEIQDVFLKLKEIISTYPYKYLIGINGFDKPVSRLEKKIQETKRAIPSLGLGWKASDLKIKKEKYTDDKIFYFDLLELEENFSCIQLEKVFELIFSENYFYIIISEKRINGESINFFTKEININCGVFLSNERFISISSNSKKFEDLNFSYDLPKFLDNEIIQVLPIEFNPCTPTPCKT